MQIVILMLMTLVTLTAAVYAHRRVPHHTPGPRDRWFLHLLLAGLGILCGWVMSQRYPISGVVELLVFLSAFGVVHIPAAAILFIKRQQQVER